MPTSAGGISYRRLGAGAEPLLLIHGLRNNGGGWQPLLDRMQLERFDVVVPDLPGCGGSAAPATWQECTIDAYAEAIEGLVAELRLDSPILVGHSLGGAIALRIALSSPRLPRALVLVNPASTQGIPVPVERLLASPLAGDDPVPGAELAFHVRPAPEVFEGVLEAVRGAARVHTEGALRSMGEFDVLEELGALRLPVLVVGGDKDGHVPARFTLQTAAAIRNASVQVFHNVGHVPQLDLPDAFAALVDEFLDELPPPEDGPPGDAEAEAR
jgi:pimeloyl-ACP methyl ester carboxylesterase